MTLVIVVHVLVRGFPCFYWVGLCLPLDASVKTKEHQTLHGSRQPAPEEGRRASKGQSKHGYWTGPQWAACYPDLYGAQQWPIISPARLTHAGPPWNCWGPRRTCWPRYWRSFVQQCNDSFIAVIVNDQSKRKYSCRRRWGLVQSRVSMATWSDHVQAVSSDKTQRHMWILSDADLYLSLSVWTSPRWSLTAAEQRTEVHSACSRTWSGKGPSWSHTSCLSLAQQRTDHLQRKHRTDEVKVLNHIQVTHWEDLLSSQSMKKSSYPEWTPTSLLTASQPREVPTLDRTQSRPFRWWRSRPPR